MIVSAPSSDFARFKSICARDATAFARVAFRRSYWGKQVELKRLMRSHDRVWAKGGHSTGKTFAVADEIIEHCAMNKGAQCVVVGATFESVRTTLWADVRKAFYSSRIPIGGAMGAATWTLGDGWFARCAGADKPETLHGVHGSHVLVVVDEASGVAPELWPALDSLMSSAGARMVVMFNPLHAEHRTKDITHDPRWRGVTLSCEDHPNVVSGENLVPGAVTRAWVDDFRERVRRGLTTQDEYRSRVLGEFPLGDANALLTMSDFCETAQSPGVRRLGLDVARSGHDRSVLSVFDENNRLVHVDAWAGADLMATTGRLLEAVERFKVDPLYASVDICGIGAGVVDRAREQGCFVTACDFGGAVENDWPEMIGSEIKLKNRRAELHLVFAALVRSKQVAVPEEFRETRADLVVPRMKYGSDGKRMVEDKEEIRARIRRSPDYGDSAIIAFNVPCGAGAFVAWA